MSTGDMQLSRTAHPSGSKLHPNPSPLLGEGLKLGRLPFSPIGRRGWGMRADFKLHIAYYPLFNSINEQGSPE